MIKHALGLAEGGAVRSALGGLLQQVGLDHWMGPKDARNGAAFTIAIVGLSAKLSKADGVSCPIEAQAFGQLYHVSDVELGNIKSLYDLAKQDTAGFETYARQIASLLADDRELLRDVLEGLFHVATADGILHEAEDHYLSTVADLFGFDRRDYRRVKALFVRDVADPYVVLDLPHDASDDEIKRRYRELVKANHPDTLAAHGVPKEFEDQANRKIAAINAAYEAIRKERQG